MTPPSPGRPRDDSVDTRAIEATLSLLEEEGPAGLTVEGIAAKAGVSKSTLYRRWDSSDEIVTHCIVSLVDSIEFPDSGDIRQDLLAVVNGIGTFARSSRAGTVLPWLMGEIAAGSDLGRKYAENVIRPRRQMILDLLEDARARGDLRSDLDTKVAVDIIVGPLLLRKITGITEAPDDGWAEAFVDSLLQGWLSR